MEDCKEAFERKGLGAEEMAGWFAGFGCAGLGLPPATAGFFAAARTKRGFAEEGHVVARGGVGSEVGGAEEVGGEVGEDRGGCWGLG